MTKSADIQVADAIVAELNAAPSGTFSQTFTATRVWVPVKDAQDVTSYEVKVVPMELRTVTLSRETAVEEYDIDVAVQVPCQVDDITTGDEARYLAEQIRDFFVRRTLVSPPVAWLKATSKIYSPERLANNNRFLTVITLTYKGARA